jgi:hypothetical protein
VSKPDQLRFPKQIHDEAELLRVVAHEADELEWLRRERQGARSTKLSAEASLPRMVSSALHLTARARSDGGRPPHRPTVQRPRQSVIAAAETPHRACEPDMQDRVRDLGSPARLEVRQQLEAAGVVGAVVHPAQRRQAVSV